MDRKYAIQCLTAIREGSKMERDIKLSLSENIRLKKVSRILRESKNFTNISFEDFVLICKLHKINSRLYITVPGYSKTYITDILDFDDYTLKGIFYKVLNTYDEPIVVSKDGKSLDLSDIKYYLQVVTVISFKEFVTWSDLLGFRIDIV